MKNSIVKWLVFLKFFFPELKRSTKVLFVLQLIFFIGSIVLAILHIDKLKAEVELVLATFPRQRINKMMKI